MEPKARFDAAAQAQRDALQRLSEKFYAVDLQTQIDGLTSERNALVTQRDAALADSAKLRSDYEASLNTASEQLEGAAKYINAIIDSTTSDASGEQTAAVEASA